MDRRGTGLSDPIPENFGLEDELEDITAVLEAAESERVVLLGYAWAALSPRCTRRAFPSASAR